MSFKIIAIRPIKDCERNFFKSLKNENYYLYNNYHIENDIVKYKPSITKNIYDNDKCKVNISAIVGKNGCGKSTVVEIIYLLSFYIAFHQKIIVFQDLLDDDIITEKELSKLKNDIENIKKIHIELYYSLEHLNEERIIKISLIDGLIWTQQCNFSKYEFNQFLKNGEILIKNLNASHLITDSFDFNEFFYSLVINYSIYNLNTNDYGIWLKTIFHKNDGYQTPIVLNPLRDKGVININRETYLAKQRVLSNILSKIEKNTNPEDSLRCLVNDKVAYKINLKLNRSKVVLLDEFESIKVHMPTVFEIFFEEDFIPTKNVLNDMAVNYVINKIVKIADTYKIYKEKYKDVFKVGNETKIRSFLYELKNDTSHVTFKLYQALNFIRYDYLDKNNMEQNLIIDKLSDKINENIDILVLEDEKKELDKYEEDTKRRNEINLPRFKSEGFIYLPKQKHDIINYLPPSFFNIDIQFNLRGKFSELSSGEKQRIYVLNSIIYHLINLKSVNGEKNIRYSKINIILDEIELYFHPEFQRSFINDLLGSIYKTNLMIELNIIFITHSPFIISDIPSSNIMFLEIDDKEKKSFQRFDKSQTFASNIHELLSDSFFMNYTKGGFALSQIKKIVNFTEEVKKSDQNQKARLLTEYDLKRNQFKNIISIIGEDVIRNTLLNHINLIEKILYPDKNEIDIKIGLLEEQLLNLKKLKR